MTDGVALPALSWRPVLDAARHDGGGLLTVRDLVRLCETVIVRAGLSCFNSMGTPRRDAEALVFHVLAVRDHSDGYLAATVLPPERELVLDLLERRVASATPLPYLTGEAFFAGLRFTVRPGVFVPRSTMGLLLRELLGSIPWPDQPRVLELGCGTGALGITIARRVPGARVDLLDVDQVAVAVAGENARRHDVADRVGLLRGDLYEPVAPEARYDLIVANLPYVPGHFAAGANAEVRAEPATAVFRPADGLDLARQALDEAPLHLTETGTVAVEVGGINEPALRAHLGDRGRWWRYRGRPVGLVTLTRKELERRATRQSGRAGSAEVGPFDRDDSRDPASRDRLTHLLPRHVRERPHDALDHRPDRVATLS